MRIEWIFFGVVLLSVGLCLKILQSRHVLPRTSLGFSIIWALAIALHFWGPVCAGLADAMPGFLDALVPAELIYFWSVAILALIPGIVLTKVLVRDIRVALPVFVDRLLSLVVPCVATIALSTSVIMSGGLLGVSLVGLVPANEGTRRICAVVETLPVKVYVGLSVLVTGQDRRGIVLERVPARVRHAFRKSIL